MEKSFYWYNVTVQFNTEDEQTGKVKKVKENYLVKGVSQTDVDTQVHKDLEGTIGEFMVLGITVSKIIRIIHPENIALND